MSKLKSDVAMSNSPNKKADVKAETGELSMEELGNVAAGSPTELSAPSTSTIMKTKHDTAKNSISNVR